MGSVDRAIRIIAAIVIAVLYFAGQITGLAAIILGIVALSLLVTSFFGFCPAYLPFKLNTGKKGAD